MSKLGIGDKSIDIGLTSQLWTITYPHIFFLSNDPPYLGIGLGMFIGPAIGVFRWVKVPTGHSTKIQLFGNLPNSHPGLGFQVEFIIRSPPLGLTTYYVWNMHELL